MLHKQLDKAHVSMKGGKMEGREAIVTLRVRVQPRFYRQFASFSSFCQASLVLRFSAPCVASDARVLRADHTAIRLNILNSARKYELN